MWDKLNAKLRDHGGVGATARRKAEIAPKQTTASQSRFGAMRPADVMLTFMRESSDVLEAGPARSNRC